MKYYSEMPQYHNKDLSKIQQTLRTIGYLLILITRSRTHMLLHTVWLAKHAFIFTAFRMKNDSSKCDSWSDLLPGTGPSVGLFEDYAPRLKCFPRELAWPVGVFSQPCWKLSAKSLVLKVCCSRYWKTTEVTSEGLWHHVRKSFLFWWGLVGVVLRVCDVRAVACIDSVDACQK